MDVATATPSPALGPKCPSSSSLSTAHFRMTNFSQQYADDSRSRLACADPVTDLSNFAAQDVDDRTPRPSGAAWVMVCFSLYVSAIMYGLDTTIAADIQGAVTDTFGEVSQLAWVGAGFPLGSVAVILPYGALYTTFNMKWLYVSGIFFFQVGSALCGAAPNMNALIVGRVIAGAGGTGIYLGVLNYFSALTTRQERSTYIAAIGFVWGIGSILGPVVGGGFSVSPATWRWGFYINLVIGAITAPIYLIYLPPVHPSTESQSLSLRQKLGQLDLLGFALSAGAWVTFAMALTSGGAIWSWDEGRTIALLVLCSVLWIAYVLQQYFCLFTTPTTRSFPGHLLRSRTQVMLYIGTSCAISSLLVTMYYIPLFFQFVHDDTPLMAAVRLLPFLLVTIVTNLAAGRLLAWVKYYMLFYVAAGILLTVAGALLYVYLSPSTGAAAIYGFTVVAGVGTGLTFNLGYAVATLKADHNDIIHATSLQNVSQIGSSVVCLVAAGQIFQSVAVGNLATALAGQGFSEELLRGGVGGVHSPLFDMLEGGMKEAATLAVTAGMQKVFALVIAAGALEVLAGAGMRIERIEGEVVTA
ncbi:hypothetical protein PG984_012231 [Apiospora sp. TS-2023a]